jgi:hypothetical protein
VAGEGHQVGDAVLVRCHGTRQEATWTRPPTTRTAIPMGGEAPAPAAEPPRQGLLDTNILVLRRWIDPADLCDEHEERARRTEAVQRAENKFDPVPFDARDMHSSRIRRDVTRTSACLGPAAS